MVSTCAPLGPVGAVRSIGEGCVDGDDSASDESLCWHPESPAAHKATASTAADVARAFMNLSTPF